MTDDKTQERFEALVKAESYDLVKDDSGAYISPPTIFAWMGYKAASAERDAEIERLRDALKALLHDWPDDWYPASYQQARAALQESQNDNR